MQMAVFGATSLVGGRTPPVTISVRILTRNTLQSGIINLTKDGPTEPGYYRPIITSS